MKIESLILVLFALALGAGLLGCDGGGGGSGGGQESAAEAPALPDLTGFEPRVADLIRRRHATLVKRLDDVDAWVRWANVLQAHKMTTPAVEAYDVVIGMVDEARSFDYHYLKGCTLELIDPARAVKSLAKAMSIRGDYLPGHLRIAALHEAAQDTDRAGFHYRQAQGIEKTSHGHLGLGRLALNAGDPPGAVAELEAARALDDRHAEVHEALARAYGRLGRKAAAQRAAAMAGRLARRKGFPDRRLSDVLMQEVSFAGLKNRANVFLSRGRPESALKLIDEALAVQPNNPDALFDRATILHVMRKHAEAARLCERVIEERPDDVDAMDLRGNCLIAMGKPAEARLVFEDALEIRDDNVQLLASYAGLVMSSDAPRAHGALMKALAKDPYHEKTLYLLAWIQFHTNQYPQAKGTLARLFEVNPKHTDGMLIEATIVMAESTVEEAQAILRKLLEIDPLHVDGNWAMASSLIKQKKHMNARWFLDKILEAVPDHPGAKRAIASLEAQQARKNESR